MDTDLTLKESISINNSAATVWEALINKEIIKNIFGGQKLPLIGQKAVALVLRENGKKPPTRTKEPFSKLNKKEYLNTIIGAPFGEKNQKTQQEVSSLTK